MQEAPPNAQCVQAQCLTARCLTLQSTGRHPASRAPPVISNVRRSLWPPSFLLPCLLQRSDIERRLAVACRLQLRLSPALLWHVLLASVLARWRTACVPRWKRRAFGASWPRLACGGSVWQPSRAPLWQSCRLAFKWRSWPAAIVPSALGLRLTSQSTGRAPASRVPPVISNVRPLKANPPLRQVFREKPITRRQRTLPSSSEF